VRFLFSRRDRHGDRARRARKQLGVFFEHSFEIDCSVGYRRHVNIDVERVVRSISPMSIGATTGSNQPEMKQSFRQATLTVRANAPASRRCNCDDAALIDVCRRNQCGRVRRDARSPTPQSRWSLIDIGEINAPSGNDARSPRPAVAMALIDIGEINTAECIATRGRTPQSRWRRSTSAKSISPLSTSPLTIRITSAKSVQAALPEARSPIRSRDAR
jgi:hypothetical protein